MADKTGRITAICISEKRGTAKKEVGSADIALDWGIVGDAHGGRWHRQISLLSRDKIEEFKRRGAVVENGAFGENIIVDGLDLSLLEIGTRLNLGSEAVVELTQRGKQCHNHCNIYKAVGDCIMPREGVFATVVKGGHIKRGDSVSVSEEVSTLLRAAVITLSDKGYSGEREDKSGPLIKAMLEAEGYSVVDSLLLPDDKERLKSELIQLSDRRDVSLILTTGGTGFSQRDVTPEATIEVCDRLARGIPEAIRAYSMTITSRAMLSRAEAGIRGRTLIVNLPGSPKAVKESLEYILPTLRHGIELLRGMSGECGR